MKNFRRVFTSALLCLTMVLLAAGCQTNTAGSSSSVSSKAVSSAAASDVSSKEGAETRTVSTVKGDIEVPLNPQRVVVNWYAGDVFTLDLNVVGFFCWAQETMPFYDKMMDTTKIENWAQEDVMALEPDLIVTYDEEDFDTFKSIAPVLVIPEGDITSPERLTILAEATGKEDVAKEKIDAFETKLAAAKESFKSDALAGKTFSILEDWGPSGEWSGVAYETGSRGGTLVYDYLNLTLPEKLTQLIEETGDGRGTLSYEVAHEYFGDYILWFRQEGKESEYQKGEIWKSIPAVAAGHVAEIPGEYQGLFYYDDVSSLTSQLDYMVEAINAIAN